MTEIEKLRKALCVCGGPMKVNLRADETFVEDDAEYERHLCHRQPRRGVHRGPDCGPIDCN